MEMLQQGRARKQKRDFYFSPHSLFCFHPRTSRVGLAGLSTGCLCVLRLGRGIKNAPLSSLGCSCGSKHAGIAKVGLVVWFWGAWQCSRTLTPPVCLRGTSQSSWGQGGNHGHSWAHPAEGHPATAAGFAHILPKNKSGQTQEPQECLGGL